jgi:hypothetical protein
MADPFTIIDDLRKQQLSETGKLTYFMLGAAGSAVAFTFHETADRSLQWSLLAPMAAIVTWAISFGAGIKLCEVTSRMLGISHATASKLLDQNSDGDVTALNLLYDVRRARGQRYFTIQLWALLAGAML